MNFSFMSPGAGQCTARLWASGRYGFSLPKKVEITTAAGATHVFLYFDKRVEVGAVLGKRALVAIAIAQFLRGDDGRAEPVEIDPDLAPYAGALTPVRTPTPRAPLRVRPGKTHARPVPTS